MKRFIRKSVVFFTVLVCLTGLLLPEEVNRDEILHDSFYNSGMARRDRDNQRSESLKISVKKSNLVRLAGLLQQKNYISGNAVVCDSGVVSFSGIPGIVGENRVATVSAKALAGLFEVFSDKVVCVILSACYSLRHAEAVRKHIKYVIGMRREIQDNSAIEFAVGFYDTLGSGRPVEEAYKLGCNAILAKFPDSGDHNVPVLKIKKSDAGSQI